MKRNSESGSLHVIVIAVLFVALMATLGIVFYQNFIAKKSDDKPQQTTQTTVKPDDITTARVAFNSDIYALDYPSGWKAATAKVADSAMGGSTAKITSRDGRTEVVLTVSEIVPDTTCSTNDGLNLTSYNVGATTPNKLAGVPLYLVEALTDNTGGGYQYAIGLTPDSGDTHAVTGQSHCTVAHVGIASSAVMSGQKLTQPTIIAKIDFPKLPVAPKPAAKDMQTIKDLMTTSDYKAAVKILESARKE